MCGADDDRGSDASVLPETRPSSPIWHANANTRKFLYNQGVFSSMPPRPRPRPRPQPVPSSSVQAGTSSCTPCHNLSSKEEDDCDALFMRNRGRSLKELNQRAADAAAAAPQTSSPAGSEEEDEDDEDTPKLGKARKQNTLGRSNALPKWAKKGGIISLLGDSDSESENNRPSTHDDTPSKRRRAGTTSATGTPSGKRGKRMRSRSRSRSLTPPPDLTLAQKISAQHAIENALRSENMLPTSAPVIVVEDRDDGDAGETELDPALQHIAMAVLHAAQQKRSDDFGSAQPEILGVSHHNSSGRPSDVNVRVKWLPHPQDELMQARPPQTWSFTMNRHHSLKELLMRISERAHFLPQDLVLTRDGKRVFTSVSPDGLGAWDQIDLEACNLATFDALRARHFRSPTPIQNTPDDTETGFNRECSAAPSEASTDTEEGQSRYKLVLRAQGFRDVTLTVRPSTSCGKIVRAFLAITQKFGGKVPTSPRKVAQVRLCIDGERQSHDTPIADCDLEDGDMVEVTGL